MRGGWFRIDPAGLPRGVVLVDATPAAAPLWHGPVASLLEELAEKLPAESHPEVAFLGDRRTHPLAGLRFTDHLGRYPVAGPLLRELERGPVRPVILVTNTAVIDLADWATPDLVRRMLVYRLTGDDRLSPQGFHELGPETDLGVLVKHLRDPATGIRTTGFALDWDNPAWTWNAGLLESTGGAGTAAFFLSPDDRPPTATVTRASGAELPLPLTATDPPAEPPPVGFSPAEGNVLELWRRGNAYWCQSCRRSHPPGVVRCPAPGTPPGLFPTLHPLPDHGLYRVGVRGGAWWFRPVRRGLLALADGRVLVGRGGSPCVFAHVGDRWQRQPGPTTGFISLADGEFAIALC